MIGEPIKRLASLIGEPIKLTGKRALHKALGWRVEIHQLAGWSYFWCWSLSFYPQLYVNWKRQSVVGLSFDFVLYNSIGFLCYAVYACTLFVSGSVRAEYARRHHGGIPSVR